MSKRSKVVDKDMGYQAFKRFVTKEMNLELHVGLLQGEIATYGAVQEYGYEPGGIPSRPWMSQTIDQNQVDLIRLMLSELRRTVGTQQASVKAALTVTGIQAVNLLKRAVADWSSPPNAPATIARKGEDNPLVDTGAMMNALTFEVRKKGARKR